ncbi:CASP-like protein 4C2 [Wolffia australiana]
MPSPSHLGNGDGENGFRSTVSVQRLRRINTLVLLLRVAGFCFSVAAAVFMAWNRGSESWLDHDPFRLVVAANAIVAVYSVAEIGASIWEVIKGRTPLPEPVQLWFDFGHDQVFAYLLLSAEAAGTAEAANLRKGEGCSTERAFCVQAEIAVALGFVGFFFLALSALFSGFRVGCYLLTGSRFPH